MTNTETLDSPSDRAGTRLRQLRKQRELSVDELAERCAAAGAPELTANAIYAIESGRRKDGQRTRKVTIDEASALAVALNVSPLTVMFPEHANDEPVSLTAGYQVSSRTAWQWARGERTAVDWEPGGLLPAAGSGVDPVGNAEAFEKEQEFNRKQAEYKALAEPVEWRRAADHSAVRLARNLEDVLVDLVAPEAGVERATLSARYRMARRRHAQLGFELDAVEERLPIAHPGVPVDPTAEAEMNEKFERTARGQAEARADVRHGRPRPAGDASE